MAQTAAQKAAALKKAAAAAIKRAQAVDDSSEKAATASRRAVIDTAPATPAQSGKYLGADGNYYNSPVEASLGRDIGKSVAQPTSAQRIATATTIRKTGTADNPIPYPAPAGANWNLYSGVWKLYYRGALIGDANGFDQSIIDSINTKATTNNTNNAGNGNNNNGNNNAGGTNTPGVGFNNGGNIDLSSLMGGYWFEDWKGNIEGINPPRLLDKMVSFGLFNKRR